MPGFHPAQRGWSSNRLEAADADAARAELLAERFYRALRDRDARPPGGTAGMIEKTPKNSLRIPFLAEVFPDARFLYLYRDPEPTIASMIEAWESGRFVTYPRLEGWGTPPWSLLLVPGWRSLIGEPIERIVARQWAETTTILLDDLAALPPERVGAVSYDRFLEHPQATVTTVCGSLGLDWDRRLGDTLPLSPTVVTPPEPGKWRGREAAVARVRDSVEPTAARARQCLGDREVR